MVHVFVSNILLVCSYEVHNSSGVLRAVFLKSCCEKLLPGRQRGILFHSVSCLCKEFFILFLSIYREEKFLENSP